MQKQRIFLIIGVVLALAGIFMIKVYLDQQRQVTEEAVQKKYERTQASQTPVLFAKKDISPGETINPDDLEIKVTPNQAVQPGAVTSLDRVFGMVVIAPIARGEQVNLSKLSQQRAASDLASATPSGKRAVSITVDDVASLGGMIKPGDYVDVIATVPIPAQTAEGKTVAQAAVMPLFQNVLVLAVGQRVGAPAAEPQ
ncbi:MAG: Flp pilus assembly protein CpaB, partial [Candidatus Omnitrophica bacterium]|nr:Flp pilus assembly protein CpaB [Candidatus Omnitrophota bacterium]